MCISVRYCARAGWTPALACANCALKRAINARQIATRRRPSEKSRLAASWTALVRALFKSRQPGP